MMVDQGNLRVVLADDHAMVRQALSEILEANERIHVVGQANDGEEALWLVRETAPDVLVVDYTMPRVAGPEVIKTIREETLNVRVLVLTVHENLHYAKRVLESGANGYVVKSAAVRELVEAIEAVHQGRTYVSPRLAKELEQAKGKGRGGLEALSAREFDVLRAFGRGLTLRECATDLSISTSTASTYRARLMDKLSLKTTAEIIRFALENDVVL